MFLFAVVILILILLLFCFKYSRHNTTPVSPCETCEKYKVHRAHSGVEEAAELLREIDSRNTKLIEHLNKKYVDTGFTPSVDPAKGGRIDIIPKTGIYASGVIESLGDPMYHEYIQERVTQLINNYDSELIYEISPKNVGNATSYTEGKKVLVLCLRQKTPGPSGEHTLHDINTMMFVVLHELSHMANKTWGHARDFWALFKFMLLNAIEIGIYQPVDYEVHPVMYCGLLLHYNPVFDSGI